MSKVIVENATAGRRGELSWRRVKIRKSLDNICRTMELEIPSGERARVRKHDMIRVRLANPLITDSGGRRLVTTVMVDEVAASVEPSGRGLTVLGRSPARDIVDSTWTDDAIWPEGGMPRTLGSLTRKIAERFGVAVSRFNAACPNSADPPDPTDGVGFFAWQNESPRAELLIEAMAQGFLLTGNAAGGLYIWRPAGMRRSEGFRVTEGRNVRTIEWRENGAERFREYVVNGAFGVAGAFDRTCNTRRILTIDLTDTGVEESKLRRIAYMEMYRRRERRTAVTVSGWGLSDAQIQRLGETHQKKLFWGPNYLIPVRMPSMDLSEDLLTAEVELEADETTMQSTVTLVNREAYLCGRS